MKTAKRMCALLTVLCVLGGLLAPLVASAQMVTTPPPPPPPMQTVREPGRGAAVGAGFLNVVYVPGKVIVCSAGVLSATALMLVTFGQAYGAATDIYREGCGGPWALSAYDVTRMPAPEDR